MTRVLIVTALSLIVGALWQSLALVLPSFLNAFLLPPLLLAFSLQYFRPFETVLIALWCGAVVDVLGGLPIGLHMLMMLGFFFFLEASSLFSGRLNLRQLSVYAGVLSLVYRVVFFFLQALMLGQKTNIFLWQLGFGPLIDWAISIPLYLLLLKVLVATKLLDQNDAVRNLRTAS